MLQLARRLSPAWIAVVAAMGCSKATTSPTCDTSGTHLVAFASDRNQTAGQFDIYLYDLDQFGFHLLRNLNVPGSSDVSPALAGDGQALAFVTNRGGGAGGTDIMIYDRGSCDFVSKPALNSGGNESEPAFSGNVVHLAFVRDTMGNRRIRMLNGVTGRIEPIGALDTLRAYDDVSPALDQTGNAIAFASNRNGNWDVFLYDHSGDSLSTLPALVSPDDDVDPAITPDGHWLCFASNRTGGSGGYDIYLVDLTTRQLVALPNLNSDQDERHPTISRDGNVILFESTRTGGKGKVDVWNYDRRSSASGVGQRPEESSAGDDLHPSVVWP